MSTSIPHVQYRNHFSYEILAIYKIKKDPHSIKQEISQERRKQEQKQLNAEETGVGTLLDILA